jgi:hypothetical protein
LHLKKKFVIIIYVKNKKESQAATKKIKKMLDRIKKICYNNNIEKEKERVKPLKTFKKK